MPNILTLYNLFNKTTIELRNNLASGNILPPTCNSSVMLIYCNSHFSTAGGFRNRIIEIDDRCNRYANVIFGGWDYTLNDERMVRLKHNSIHNEIRVSTGVFVCVAGGGE